MVDAVKVTFAKKEATYATDAAPTAALNGVLTRNFRRTPVVTDRLERNLDLPGYGGQASVPSAERAQFSFETEIAGAGAAGTAPAWMELIEGCGMAAPTLVAGASATQTFALAGANATSLTHYFHLSNQRQKVIGAHGTYTLDFTAGAYPFIGYEWTGLLATVPFDTATPGAVTLTRWKQPVEVNDANTIVLIDGYVTRLRSFKAASGTTVAMRNLVGSRYIRRGNHAVTGTAVIEAPAMADKDYIARLRSGALFAFSIVHGTVAGNIVEMTGGAVQCTAIEESEEDDIVMWTLSLAFTVEGGVADLTIIAR